MEHPCHPSPPQQRGNFFWRDKKQGKELVFTMNDQIVAVARILPDTENHWLRICLDFPCKPQEVKVDGENAQVDNFGKVYSLSQQNRYEIHRMMEYLLSQESCWKEWTLYFIAREGELLAQLYHTAGLQKKDALLPHFFSKKGNFHCWEKINK